MLNVSKVYPSKYNAPLRKVPDGSINLTRLWHVLLKVVRLWVLFFWFLAGRHERDQMRAGYHVRAGIDPIKIWAPFHGHFACIYIYINIIYVYTYVELMPALTTFELLPKLSCHRVSHAFQLFWPLEMRTPRSRASWASGFCKNNVSLPRLRNLRSPAKSLTFSGLIRKTHQLANS